MIASASGGQADRNASCATPTTTWPLSRSVVSSRRATKASSSAATGCGQLVAADPPPGGAALLVHGDQPQQLLDHLVAAPAARGGGVGEGGVGLAGQRPLHPTQLLIPAGQQPPPAPHPVGQLGQRVGQQRQRLPAVGVGDQPRHQVLVHARSRPAAPGPRSPRAAPPGAAAAARAPVSGGRPGPGRRAAGRGTPGAGCRRPAPGRPAPGPAGRRTGPARPGAAWVSSSSNWSTTISRCVRRGPGPGQQQVVGELGQPTVVEPAANVGRRPAQPAAGGRRRRVPGSAPPPAGFPAGSPAPSASRVRRPSPAAARPAPATTSRTPTGPPPAAPHASARSAGDRSSVASCSISRVRPKNTRCRSVSNGRNPGNGDRSSGQPDPPAASSRRNASASFARAAQMSVAAIGPLHRLQQRMVHPGFGPHRQQPAPPGLRDHQLGGTPRPTPGRPRSAGTPPRRPSAAAHAAAAPTPPPPRCRRADPDPGTPRGRPRPATGAPHRPAPHPRWRG